MKRKLAFLLFLFTSLIGVSYELESYFYGGLSLGKYQNLGVNIPLLILYLLPAGLLIRHFQKKWNINGYATLTAFFGSWCITGWFAGYGNSIVTDLWGYLITNADTLDEWSASLSAPFVEEFIKLIAALLVIYLFKVHSFKGKFLIGAIAGLGFQAAEDISYIFNSVMDTPYETLPVTFMRISGAVASHWLYTAIVTLGFVLILQRKSLTKVQGRLGWFYFLAPVVIHFVWNSPLTTISVPLDLIVVTLSTISLLLLFHAYQTAKELDDPKTLG